MQGSFSDSTEAGKHQQLHVSLPGARLPGIIVPTKLGSTNPGAGQLAGLRFAVKDIFHIKGMKTSGGSLAYYQIYDYQNYTMETVEFCLNAGAELIGKLKTIAFALGAPNNGQEIDYPDPWSARGDGYQNTGGSSSGSGAAVAAYDWVDFTLGSDTGGSVRFPARYGGFYGYKPTHGIFSLTGILVAIAAQDTPGFKAHSPEIFTRVGRIWAKNKPLPPAPASLPKKILRYLDQPTNLTKLDAKALVEGLYTKLTAALRLETVGLNMTKAFLEANISQPNLPQTMPQWMSTVYSDQNDVELWDEIGKDMVQAYGSIPDQEGAWPPVDPPVNASWTSGENETTRARYPEAQQKRITFANFFNTIVLPPNEETCSEYIFAHTYHTPPSLVKVHGRAVSLRNRLGWYDGIYTNYAVTPEIVVPIGQVEYWSPSTRRIEWQPVTVALGMAKGCDNALFALVDRLAAMELLVEMLPGKVAYPVAN
jgi:Asp-tRNA(Asn)/Glu-tRNA(Gln) amidotransferase A subunit family amidase